MYSPRRSLFNNKQQFAVFIV